MLKNNKQYEYYNHTKINNLKEMFDINLERNPNDIAYSFRENNNIVTKTFKDVYKDTIYLSNYFYSKYNNKHIGIISENSYNYIITVLGIILSGNVAVLIDKDLEEEKIKELIKKSDVKSVYYSSYIKFKVSKGNELEDIKNYIQLGKTKKNKYKIDDNKEAVIFFTSGTEGPNKAVMLSQKNIASNLYGASSLFKPNGGVVSILPFHHAFGFVTSILKPFYYGKEVFITSSLKKYLKDIQMVKPDTLFVVPLFIQTFYKQIWKEARKNKKDKKLKLTIKLSNRLLKLGIDKRRKLFKEIHNMFGGNLNYIICGGAYLDEKYIKWFRSIGIEILNGYGITECSPVVSVNRNLFNKEGSVGLPCRETKVKIIDDEICVKGDNVMLGYYKDKKATAKVIKDGYYHTGDLGYIDEDGFIFIKGRIKDIIILSNGENISPEEIESDLYKDEAVNEVIVYEENNNLVASIYPEEEYMGDQEYFDNLIYEYNKDKPKNHQISYVKLRTTEFIKNNNKKILRNKVKER